VANFKVWSHNVSGGKTTLHFTKESGVGVGHED